jgi:anaerobic magnesium-protoporphyrin IX monomethyl ester cyclase
MKITFIEPPPLGQKIPERLAGCSYELYHFPDLANFYLMAVLAKAGIQVDYIDCVMTGFSENELVERLQNDSSDYYVIHSVILSKPADQRALDKILMVRKNAGVIFHGPEPTRVPEEYLRNNKVLVFRGEPELNVPIFLSNGKVQGMSYLQNGVARHVPPSGELVNLDYLPFPMRDHESMRSYMHRYSNPKFSRSPHTTMMTSRGCNFRCLFCVPISISFARELEYRNYFNKKPPASVAGAARVIAEFKEIVRLGYRSVMIVDDQFLWAKGRTLEICEGIKPLGIEWGCLSRADFLTDPEIITALAASGCHSIDIGAESLNQSTLDYVRKDLKTETITTAINTLKQAGIRAKLNIMLGTCPEESRQDLKRTIKRVGKLPVSEVMFSLATPFKGTEFYNFCKTEGFLIDESENIDPIKKSMVSYPRLQNRELERLQKYAYRSYYLRWQYILRRLKSYKKISDLIRDLKIALRLFR